MRSSQDEKKRSAAEEAMKEEQSRPNSPGFTIMPSRAPMVGTVYTDEQFAKDLKRELLPQFSHLTEDQIFDIQEFPANSSLCLMKIESNFTIFKECAEFAISKHNEQNVSSYKFTEIVKAIGTPRGLVVYLIYKAKESEDGIPLTFKTKFTISRSKNHIIQYTSFS